MMSDTNKDQASGQKADPTWTEAQRLLLEIEQFREQAEDQSKAAETARKTAESEGLFAFNAKKACEEHATAISQVKGNVEAESNAIHNHKQQSDELLAALTAGKATIDAEVKMICERRKEADLASSSIEEASETCATHVQELDKSKTAAVDALRAITESRESASLTQKSAEASQAEVEACSVDAQAKVKTISENHTTSSECSLAIQATLENAKTSETQLKTVLEHLKQSDSISTVHEARVAKLTEDLELLIKRVVGLLPGATSAGLASSFNAQKLRFAKPQRRWLKIFIWCIVGLIIVALPSFIAALGFPVFGHSSDSTPTELRRGLMLRMPIVIPIVWLAIYAGRNYMLSLRLEEEYAYKEAVSTAFEGYKREMKDIEAGDAENPSPLTKLCANILAAIAERPGRIYEGKPRDITILNETRGAAQEISKLAKNEVAPR